MADKSGIEWTDATWNPVTGCTKVSPGCDHCYAETFAERWRGVPGHHFERGFDLTMRPERLDQPLRWRRPRRVFVNSMSDLFHDKVPTSFLDRAFEVMARTPQHTYQILTKRHARMRSYMRNHPPGDGWPLPNVWLGVSVENQHWADIRIPALLNTPAAIRWISAEPLLGPIDLHWCAGVDAIEQDWTAGTGALHPLLDWVVVGGESGRQYRPMDPAWARSLRDQCVDAGVPFFFKQWGGRTPKANRVLDRRTWDQYPDQPEVVA